MTDLESKLKDTVGREGMDKEAMDKAAMNKGIEKGMETPWAVIESYFKDQHLAQLVRHQIESYNNFVNYQIQKTIDMFNPVQICSENDFDKESGKYSLEMFITI